MTFTNILSLLGGLALFLYGMNLMACGFKHMAGNRLQEILEKLTSTPFIGLVVGIAVTGIIQSSSATTSMLVCFVDAGIMTVSQTVGVIMGANIGTTVTGQLIALNVDGFAPMLAAIGVVFIMFTNNAKANAFGEILTGFGFLFMGMTAMGDAMLPLQTSEYFLRLITTIKNPLVGIALGAIFTALIQSSSASVGIIQVLAKSGIVSVADVLYFNCGQHIGTCITAILTSLIFSREAKRVASIHLIFNVIGTVILSLLYLLTPIDKLFTWLLPGNPVGQIAMMHSFFSIVTACFLFPFTKQLARLAYVLLPDNDFTKELKPELAEALKMDDTAAASLFGINVELNHMFALVRDNIEESMNAIIEQNSSLIFVRENETKINAINEGILNAILKAMASNITPEESEVVGKMYQINNDMERLGDHAMNLAEASHQLTEKELRLSDTMLEELGAINETILMSLNAIDHISKIKERKRFDVVNFNEEKMDLVCKEYRDNQINRMKHDRNSFEESILYSEILSNFERISDHLLNIIEELYLPS